MNTIQIKNNLVISGSFDGTVQVWNMDRHEKLWQVDHRDRVWCTLVRNDQVITCCEDKSVRVLSLDSGEELHRLEHPNCCYSADLSPNKSLLAVACGSAVVLWDIKKALKVEQFDLCSQIYDLRFNLTGDRLIVGAGDGQVFKIEMK